VAKTNLTARFGLKAPRKRNFVDHTFSLNWQGQFLRNKENVGARKWRQIDLGNTRAWRVDRDTGTLTLVIKRSRSSKEREWSLRFTDREQAFNWVYWILVSLTEHSECPMPTTSLDAMESATPRRGIQRKRLNKLKGRRGQRMFRQRFREADAARAHYGADDLGELPELRVGTRITGRRGQYDYQTRVGSGGQGMVVQGTINVLNHIFQDEIPFQNVLAATPVVIKFAIPPKLKTLGAVSNEALREAQFLLGLSPHENIARLIDVAAGRTGAYVIMERLGQTLDQLVNTQPVVTINQMVEITRGLLVGLVYMHELGVYHQDIKPENIMLNPPDMTPKFIDFGLAVSRNTDPTQKLIDAKGSGTQGYLPQECFAGNYPTTKHAVCELLGKRDVYALGMSLVECLAGKRASNIWTPPSRPQLVSTEAYEQRKNRQIVQLLQDSLAVGHNATYTALAGLFGPMISFNSAARPTAAAALASVTQIAATIPALQRPPRPNRAAEAHERSRLAAIQARFDALHPPARRRRAGRRGRPRPRRQ
jgi:serine/threonine protein kinase